MRRMHLQQAGRQAGRQTDIQTDRGQGTLYRVPGSPLNKVRPPAEQMCAEQKAHKCFDDKTAACWGDAMSDALREQLRTQVC